MDPRHSRRSALLGNLLATRSYKLRLFAGTRGGAFVSSLPFLALLLLRNGRQESFRHLRKHRLLLGTQRLYEMRRYHYEQFVGRFLLAAAAENPAKDRNVAQPWNLVH